mmetsp:Transcript_7485/g.8502  ORF Transcript_7485/g.8502 Transcript_7485/m.8502 type:complete len:109 (+) Transcript_7485:96-422(+)
MRIRNKRNQLHYSMRLDDQKYAMGQVSGEIEAMESEEKEILERLKNSQRMEQEAYLSLENAIKASVDCTDQRKRIISQRHRIPIPIAKPRNSIKPGSSHASVYEQSLH